MPAVQSRRRLLRAVPALAGGAVASVIVAAWPDRAVRAHAETRASDPADGAVVDAIAHVELRFTAPVRLTRISLSHAETGAVALPEPRSLTPSRDKRVPLPDLAPGRYRLEWRGLSADGHAIQGATRFELRP
jgi:hypothetical protein